MHPSCFIQSYAKINVTLDILRKRSDGYHDLATVMQVVDIYDTICLTAIPQDEVQLVCSRPELEDADNLVVRAAQAVRQRLRLKQGVKIELQKRIPVAAGMGGGSGNAAAVLVALQRWWNLPLSHEDLVALALPLGSDVPFFLFGGTALCDGPRGQRITPLPPNWPASMRWILLLKPAIGVSAADAFRHLPPSDYTTDAHTHAVCAALRGVQPLSMSDLHNGLERVVLERYPEVRHARDAMLQAGASVARMTGSGSTIFAPFSDLKDATRTQEALKAQGYEVFITRPTNQEVFQFCSE